MQSFMQRYMVMTAWGHFVKDRHYSLSFPLVSLAMLLTRLTFSKGPSLRRDFAKHTIGGKRIHHVPQYRIVDAVSHKAHHVVSE